MPIDNLYAAYEIFATYIHICAIMIDIYSCRVVDMLIFFTCLRFIYGFMASQMNICVLYFI